MKTKFGALIAAFAVLFLVIYATPEVKGLTLAGKKALGVAMFAIVIWATQALEDALSGLVIVFLLAALQASSIAVAFSGYANTSVWLIVLGFIMAGCMEHSGLSKRIALIMVNAAKGSANKIYWAVAGVMAVMTFLVPSITARTLLMLPIVLGIGQAFNAQKGKSNIVKALMFIIAMSGTLMSIGVLTAHVGNPITVGLIEAATKTTISWSEWFKVGGPPAFIIAFLSVFLIQMLWPPEIKNLGDSQNYISQELEKLGQISTKEKITLLIFSLTLILWATDSIHKINAVIVGMLSVILLLSPKIGIMTWKEAQSKVPWNVFVLYGAGLSMGAALVSSGAAKWLASTVFAPIVGMSYAAQIVIIIWVITVLQVFFTGGGPKTTALTPIIIAHAISIGADPATFALIIGMNMQHQYLLPVSNMPNAVAMGTGYVSVAELVKTGAYMSIFAAICMSITVYTYWTWLGLVK